MSIPYSNVCILDKYKKKSDGNMNIYQEICFPFDKKKSRNITRNIAEEWYMIYEGWITEG